MTDKYLEIFLYVVAFFAVYWFLTPRKEPRKYRSTPLACLLEDAPESALTGQSYPLATPLATPIACVVPRLWHEYYRRSLARPDIDYWRWRDFPEHASVRTELNLLLDLPPPRGYVKEILESLALNRDPFFHPFFDVRIGSKRSGEKGRFADRHHRVQALMREEFKRWNRQTESELGKERLKAVYRVCYGVAPAFIARILYPPSHSLAVMLNELSTPDPARVLDISPFTPVGKIEANYRTLLLYWHPDRNYHPSAGEITALLNLSYEKYRNSPTISKKTRF